MSMFRRGVMGGPAGAGAGAGAGVDAVAGSVEEMSSDWRWGQRRVMWFGRSEGVGEVAGAGMVGG